MIMTVDTTNINLSYCMISNEIKANLDTCYIQSASFIFNVYKCNLPVLNWYNDLPIFNLIELFVSNEFILVFILIFNI